MFYSFLSFNLGGELVEFAQIPTKLSPFRGSVRLYVHQYVPHSPWG